MKTLPLLLATVLLLLIVGFSDAQPPNEKEMGKPVTMKQRINGIIDAIKDFSRDAAKKGIEKITNFLKKLKGGLTEPNKKEERKKN